MTSETQARADWRVLMSGTLIGSGIGLGLGAIYLSVGMAHAAADHARAVRIAEAAEGGFSEAMLQREIKSMDPAAIRLVQAYDDLAADSARDLAEAWPARSNERLPTGHHSSALDASRQLDCLTQAVYFEARGETLRGQAAVAQVVMNRVNSPSFPKTVCAVVFQGAATHGCQFSFACDGSMSRGLETDAWERARRIAERTLSGVVLADIGNATHFHTTSVQPDWGPQMLRVAQVGLHIFYRFNPHAPLSRPDLTDNRAVFVSLPMASGGNIRLATALLEKAADATVAVTLAPAEAKPQAPKPSDALARVPEPASQARAAASDAAAS